MADDLTGNVWVIDSAGVKSTALLYVERVAWKNAVAAGDTVKIIDGNGKTVWEHFAPGAIANTSEPVGKVWNGVTIATMSSGKLYITHR